MKKTVHTLAITMLVMLVSCEGDDPLPEELIVPSNVEEYTKATDGLKDYYDKDAFFAIGAAIEPSSLDKPAEVHS